MSTGILEQMREARRHPLAAVVGALLGALVPIATYTVAHLELAGWRDPRAALVAAGLLFSAKTVWQWGRQAFACPWKATGFVLLTEGVMVTSSIGWLAQLALAYLIGINAIATACLIAHEDKPAIPAPSPTVTAVARELSLPRKAAAKVVDRQLASAKARPA
jgi:hypothetical protein